MKKTWFIIAAVIALPVLGLAGLGALSLLYLNSAESLSLTEVDEARLVRASDLAPYFEDWEPSAEFELSEKLEYVDGAVELSYEFDSPLDSDPYIQLTITRERNAREARGTYGIQWTAQIAGLNLVDSEIDVEEDNDFYSAGERSRFGDIMYEGEMMGHMFVAQQGETVFAYMLSGFLLDDPEIWHELFDEVIAGL